MQAPTLNPHPPTPVGRGTDTYMQSVLERPCPSKAWIPGKLQIPFKTAIYGPFCRGLEQRVLPGKDLQHEICKDMDPHIFRNCPADYFDMCMRVIYVYIYIYIYVSLSLYIYICGAYVNILYMSAYILGPLLF